MPGLSISEAIRARRSVGKMTARTVSSEEITSLLELAILAPNHRLTEPAGFIVVGPEGKRRFGEIRGDARARKVADPLVAAEVHRKSVADAESIPVLLLFTQRLHADPEIREEDFATVYMGVQNLLLGALELGLATHVKTGQIFNSPAMREAMGVPEGTRVVAAVQLGEAETVPAPPKRVTASERTVWVP
jgi:nitroreductase